ncbi:MAG: ABC transporter permease [Candidatus Hodarchaeales archaeon]|jgi:ABC-type antimicrobial peptide transport system permease subunit
MAFKPNSILFGIKSVLRRKQKNLFAILAIALGVSLIAGISITSDSLGDGFGMFFTYSLGERDGSIKYLAGSPAFLNDSDATTITQSVMNANPTDIVSASFEIDLSVTSRNDEEGQISIGTPLVGIDKDEDSSYFGELISESGSSVKTSDLGFNEVYIGKTLAADLKLSKDDKFNISLSLYGMTIPTFPLTVKEIIKVESRGKIYWGGAIYVDLQVLQQLIGPQLAVFGLPNQPITQINLKFSDNINNIDVADDLVENMKTSVGALEVTTQLGGIDLFLISADRETIKDSASTLSEALGQMLTIFGSIIIFAGLLLISNIQLMTVEDRQQQTGIQRAIGTQGRQVIVTNLTEFVITGLVGGFVGIFGAILYARLLIEAFGIAFGFSGSLIPIIIAPGVLTMSFLFGFILALITGLLPAFRASRINIVETLRGVENKAESIERGTGMWGLYIGLFMIFLGFIVLSGSDVQPWNYPDAYYDLEDATSLFFVTIFLLVGISVLLSYFLSRDVALTIAGLILVIVPIIHVFWIFQEIKEGTGGANYILGMTLCMIIGNIMLIGINLSRVADLAEAIFGKFFSAVSMLSFRQMASQRTRSTLTFAIFAVILTLNIFIASWAYSDRYGSIKLVESMGGGSDVLIKANQPLNGTLATLYLEGLETQFSDEITYAETFSNSGFTQTFLKDNGTVTPEDGIEDDIASIDLFAINNKSFWDDNDEIKFNMLISPEKINSTSFEFPIGYEEGFETDDRIEADEMYKDSNLEENEDLWKALADNIHVENKTDGRGDRPIIISSIIGKLDMMEGYIFLKDIGDSVWLPTVNTDASNHTIYKEFIIAGIASNNPLFDAGSLLEPQMGPMAFITNAFVNEEEARDLAAFNQGNYSYLDQSNYFLIRGKEGVSINSEENVNLAQKIEEWSNKASEGGSDETFRDQYGLYGMVAISVYSMYEIAFDGQFRFFSFIQAFTSFGFIVGVLGLLVVSVRSVQERKREIGMMRSIGLKRYEVIISIMMELSVMGVIGLFIGAFCGNILAMGLVKINSAGQTTFLIPWFDPWYIPYLIPGGIAFYAILTLGAAFIAAIIPGISAAKIPPSEALRYTG